MAALLLAALLGGAGAVAVVVLRADTDPEATPTGVTGTTSGTSLAPESTAPPPGRPGIEPPTPGDWPASWPRFTATDRTTTLRGLDGLGFSFKVPEGWGCDLVGRAAGHSRFNCGPTVGGSNKPGGELVVRDCPKPCDGQARVQMRRAEEAWGLQWVRAGGFGAYAETSSLDGAPRYGLVFVQYWHVKSGELPTRQLVFRMTAPAEQAAELRKVANDIRGAARQAWPGPDEAP